MPEAVPLNWRADCALPLAVDARGIRRHGAARSAGRKGAGRRSVPEQVPGQVPEHVACQVARSSWQPCTLPVNDQAGVAEGVGCDGLNVVRARQLLLVGQARVMFAVVMSFR